MLKKTKGVIAAGHQKTAEAGQEILNLGGNAFDAAVAAMLASFVVESLFTSLGGGGFFLAHTQSGQNRLYDFFTQTPQAKKPISDIDFYDVNLHFGGAIQSFHIGYGSIAVPGNIAGVFLTHQHLGRLPFQEVIQPAIAYARNGFAITKFQHWASQLLAPIMLNTPASRQIYAPHGELLTPGQICYRRDLADTLTELAVTGSQEFYQGTLAQQIVKDCQEKGGYLTLSDLNNYQVIVREPLQINYQKHEILTNPPPSSGGILIAFALKNLETCPHPSEFGTPEHLTRLAKTMALTNQARACDYDPYINQQDIAQEFLSQKNLNKWGSTTHISVMDEEGNAASVTTTNGEGSSYIIPGTGIMLNNMLGEADLNPQGFHNWDTDRRLSSMMAPTLVLKQGKPSLVLGSGGSSRIRTAILQVIANIIDFDFSLQQAVESPRVHWEDHIFNVEPPLSLDEAKLPPTTKPVLWQAKSLYFGGVHAVGRSDEGNLQGIGDPRRDGAAAQS